MNFISITPVFRVHIPVWGQVDLCILKIFLTSGHQSVGMVISTEPSSYQKLWHAWPLGSGPMGGAKLVESALYIYVRKSLPLDKEAKCLDDSGRWALYQNCQIDNRWGHLQSPGTRVGLDWTYTYMYWKCNRKYLLLDMKHKLLEWL